MIDLMPRQVKAARSVALQVNLPSLLRDSVGGRDELRATGATLGEALDGLLTENPLLRIHLYDDRGKQRPHVLIYFNGESIRELESLDVPLRNGDQVTVIQAVSGG